MRLLPWAALRRDREQFCVTDMMLANQSEPFMFLTGYSVEIKQQT
jgi:hypothetical protein